MTKQEIIELWKNVGWNTLQDYHIHLNSNDPRIIIPELNPDKINPKTFWEAADQHFGTDPVCNQTSIPERILDIQEANYKNHLLTIYSGMAGQTLGLAAILNDTLGRVDMAEIGCGYSSAKSLYMEIENKYYTKTSYTGFDIIKRVSSAIEIDGEDGTFSDEQIKKYTEEFNLFFSSNTFQHLTRYQIESYLRGIYTMLPYGGYFNLMYVDDCDKTYHYGQVIEIMKINDLIKMAEILGFEVVGSTKIVFKNSLTPHTLVFKK
jgi:hypothetical protein